MTAKAWYWTGLGMLILSIGSSNTGRCWVEKASEMVDQLRTKTVPYVAMAEMAMGRTQAGLGHMQAARAHFEEQQARLQAAQARLEAQHARLEALAAERQFRHMNVLTDYSGMSDFDVEVPGVSVSPRRVVVRARRGAAVCPQVHLNVPAVDIPTPQVSVMQDPI